MNVGCGILSALNYASIAEVSRPPRLIVSYDCTFVIVMLSARRRASFFYSSWK